jgi:hypothetical protein
MKKCAKELEIAVNQNKADAKNLAYLLDRIAVLEDNPQLYGTQFDWNENGILSPNKFDNIIKVNQRRKSIGLNTLEQQTNIIGKRVRDEKQKPPTDFETRKQEMEKKCWMEKIK